MCPFAIGPTLYLETLYSVGSGAFVAFFLLSPVVLKNVVGGQAEHLAVLQAMLGGSSLLSPAVSYIGQRLRMRSLVVVPNLLVAALLLITIATVHQPMFFAIVVGLRLCRPRLPAGR